MTEKDCVKTGFLRLLRSEKHVTNFWKHKIFKSYMESRDMGNSLTTGSLAQGSFSAGFFEPDSHSDEFLVKNIDIDVEAILPMKLTEDCIKNIKGKPGYLRILTRCITEEMVDRFDMEVISNKNKYIQIYQIKKLFQVKLLTKNKPDIKLLRLYYKMFWKSNNVLDLTDWKVIIKKATCQVTWCFQINGEPITIRLDLAAIIKTDFQPTIMKDFEKRTTFLISNELLKYIFVIPKPSLQEKKNNNTTEWSYSYVHIENHIFAKQLTETQRLVHLIFKSIINKNLKYIDPDTITSYIFKTLLFWKCHHLPPENPYWNDTNTMAAVQGLFQDFLYHLRTGFLPSYFVPQINVMEKFNLMLRQICIEQIKSAIIPNLSQLIKWHELKEAIRLVEIGINFKQNLLDHLYDYKITRN